MKFYMCSELLKINNDYKFGDNLTIQPLKSIKTKNSLMLNKGDSIECFEFLK